MGVGSDQTSLVTIAKDYLKKKYDKPGNVYLGIVSRLDSFVSGVIVLARTSKAAARLNKQFANKQPTKKYWAIVPANQCGDSKTLEHWVTKDEPNHRMMTVAEDSKYKPKKAILTYNSIGEFQSQKLLEIKLLTGRKHQIRLQLSASGIPIVGDRKYGSPISFPKGIALHSQSLTIEHPTQNRQLTFSSQPPDYWNVHRFRK